MKKLFTALTAVLFYMMLFAAVPAAALDLVMEGKTVEYDGAIMGLSIDGTIIETDVPPVILEDRTLVPARAVFEKLGSQVTWHPETRKVGIQTSERSIFLTINEKTASINGFPATMDVPAMIINDRTFIPLRFVGESLGFKVGWHPDSHMVSVNTDAKITELTFATMEGKSQLVIRGTRPLKSYTVTEDPETARLVVDVDAAYLGLLMWPKEIKDPFVKSVKATQYSENPYKVRVEIEMKSWTNYRPSFTPDKHTLLIDFSNDGKVFKGINYEKEAGQDTVLIGFSSMPRYNVFRLTGPDRVVVDLSNTTNPEGTKTIEAGGAFIESIRYSQYDQDTTRVVLDLKGQYQYDVFPEDNRLRIVVKNPTYKNLSYINNGDTAWLEIRGVDLTGKYSKKMDVEGKKFVLAFDQDRVDLGDGRININDGFLSAIEIKNEPAANLTRIIFYEKNDFVFDITGDPVEKKTRVQFYKAGTKGSDRLVVIDPGHGDTEPGAVWGDLKEKDFNVDIGKRLNQLLEGKGIKTYMTREDDTFVGLYERAYIANNLKATLFVSLHNNAVWDQKVSGTMTLYNPNDGLQGMNGKRFAQIAQEKLVKYLGLPDKKIVPRPELVVLRETKMPAILAEFAFLTNASDREKLQQPEFRQKCAQALCDAIVQALNEMGN